MGQRWALLIGINRYRHLDRSHHLRGCVKDVEILAAVLHERFEFPLDHLITLTDEQATRAHILQAFDRLAGTLHTPGLVHQDDEVVIHYSGHGSQVRDLHEDEADGMDETIVPFDSRDCAGSIRDITDDEIYDVLLRLNAKTPYVTVIADCCHSGTITRDPFGERIRQLPADQRPFRPDEISIAPHTKGQKDAGPSGFLPLSERFVLLAACRDKEAAFEMIVSDQHSGERYHCGALTYYLCQSLSQASPDTTWLDVFESLAREVHSRFSTQTPQLEGAHHRHIFGTTASVPEPFSMVHDRSAAEVVVKVGAIHGATSGSVWQVHSKGTHRPSAESFVGQVQLQTVGALTSRALILREIHPGAIQPLMRAFELEHVFPDDRLCVEVAASCRVLDAEYQALSQRVTKSTLLRLARSTETDSSDVHVEFGPPRHMLELDVSASQPGPALEPFWAVIDRAGQIVLRQPPTSPEQTVDLLLFNLEAYAKYQRVLQIRHPGSTPVLQNQLATRLLRLKDDGHWQVAEPVREGGYVEFVDGDRLAIELENHAAIPLFVTVLDFGLTGAITQVYPPRGASEALAPHAVLRVGEQIGDELIVGIPKLFPSHRLDGKEYLKVLITTQPTDFSLLLQPGYRDSGQASSVLARLVRNALTGFRDLGHHSIPDEEDWATREVPLLVRRRPAVRPGTHRDDPPGSHGQAAQNSYSIT